MNQVGLVGRLTKDPNLRTFSEDRVQASFMIAINRNFKNYQGNIDANFVPCIAWGRLAERIANYCGKGSLVGISGRLQSRSYTNKENTKVYTIEVLAEDVRFYVLKTPEGKTQQNSGNVEVPKDFVLPEQASAVPVL
ncbi:single-stranded DNA-binding protein [Lysinibacillus yapensis]|uniref:Single-stranded DNA-binding protein n=1 Tax=Ureibacillus yapensis TaxID=2304605 RepID=A0A396SE49_9BACL|nr:single-stranded DNA-binding protein [Lysinibacillus yapensis]RHW39983.1 single-stranded DNA-binding protein [Lysinibacillus yapensis]